MENSYKPFPKAAPVQPDRRFLLSRLSHLIALQGVTVEHDEGVLTVNVVYRLLADGSAQQATFTAPGA